jgi:hypothetical protein
VGGGLVLHRTLAVQSKLKWLASNPPISRTSSLCPWQGGRLAVNKERSYGFYLEGLNLKKLKEVESNEQYRVRGLKNIYCSGRFGKRWILIVLGK